MALALAIAAVGATAAVPASATSLISANLHWGSGGQSGSVDLLTHANTTCSDDGKAGSCGNTGWTAVSGLYQVIAWNSEWDTDPFVTNSFTIRNLSPVTLMVDVPVFSPVLPTGPQTAMSGSVGITLTNTTGTAVLTDSAAFSVYEASIDGSVVRTLMDAPYLQTCGTAFCTVTNGQDFGISPNPPEIGPAAAAFIGIRIRFELSPGDEAGVTSVFNIEAVPEPGTALLVGMGLLGLAFAGRRS